MSLTVLLTTSGVGSRLGELTKHTNKCLVRVDDKPAISHVIESYPEETEFIITLGHFGSHVKQFLLLAYPNLNFTFVEIDKFEGEGSSLGYSIFKCKDYIKSKFIYHACDTIVKDLSFNKNNFIVGCKKNNVSQFRTLRYSSNKIYDKGEIEYDLAYVGICGIEDYKDFFNILEKLLEHNFFELSDVDVVNIMSKYTKFDIVEVKDWYDIGNNGELLSTRQHFKSSYHVLDKPQESIFFFDDFVIKFFSDPNIVENRLKRADILKNNVPEIISHTENFYKYKKIYSTLLADNITPINFIKLLEWSKDNLWSSVDCPEINTLCYNFYYHKTYERVSKYLKNYDDTDTIINDLNVPHILKLLEKVDFEYLSKGISVNFHGDFILDNILYDGQTFKLLDWRQDFQGSLISGDIYYDLAKLNHNLILNHTILDNNLFKLDFIKDDVVKCDVLISSVNLECQRKLHRWICEQNYDLNKVNLLTSLIWLNMCPLHEYPLNRFLFYFGKYNLHLNLEYMNE